MKRNVAAGNCCGIARHWWEQASWPSSSDKQDETVSKLVERLRS